MELGRLNCAGQGCSERLECRRYRIRLPRLNQEGDEKLFAWASFDIERIFRGLQVASEVPGVLMGALKKQDPESELADACVRYADDPLNFVRWVFDWDHDQLKDSDGPDVWQADILTEIGNYAKAIARGENPGPLQLAVASGHGIGKSALVAWIIGWFMSTRDHPQIVVTANTETQLLTKTWRTLSRWHKLMANAHWFDWTATKFAYKQSPQGLVRRGCCLV
jgi:hypothetical protein